MREYYDFFDNVKNPYTNELKKQIDTVKKVSTFDMFMKDSDQKELFDEEYNKFLLSELSLEDANENKTAE